jgi:hypothetical protein
MKIVTSLLLVGALLFSACGGLQNLGVSKDRSTATEKGESAAIRSATPGSQAAEQPEVCSLISREEMSAILGGSVVAEGSASDECTYRPASGEGVVPYAQVKIAWTGGEAAMVGTKMGAKAMGGSSKEMGDAAQRLGFPASEVIEGVGDEAQMIIGGVMMVRKGDTLITVDLRMQPEGRKKAIAIAQKVLSRI